MFVVVVVVVVVCLWVGVFVFVGCFVVYVGWLFVFLVLFSLSPTFDSSGHTPSIAFRHLPPNSARFSYPTEGALFISAQLSTDAVSALRKVSVLIRLWKQTKHPSTHVNMRRIHSG